DGCVRQRWTHLSRGLAPQALGQLFSHAFRKAHEALSVRAARAGKDLPVHPVYDVASSVDRDNCSNDNLSHAKARGPDSGLHPQAAVIGPRADRGSGAGPHATFSNRPTRGSLAGLVTTFLVRAYPAVTKAQIV